MIPSIISLFKIYQKQHLIIKEKNIIMNHEILFKKKVFFLEPIHSPKPVKQFEAPKPIIGTGKGNTSQDIKTTQTNSSTNTTQSTTTPESIAAVAQSRIAAQQQQNQQNELSENIKRCLIMVQIVNQKTQILKSTIFNCPEEMKNDPGRQTIIKYLESENYNQTFQNLNTAITKLNTSKTPESITYAATCCHKICTMITIIQKALSDQKQKGETPFLKHFDSHFGTNDIKEIESAYHNWLSVPIKQGSNFSAGSVVQTLSNNQIAAANNSTTKLEQLRTTLQTSFNSKGFQNFFNDKNVMKSLAILLTGTLGIYALFKFGKDAFMKFKGWVSNLFGRSSY
jgi:hypothetical protein